jgi:chromosome segregation ATPase
MTIKFSSSYPALQSEIDRIDADDRIDSSEVEEIKSISNKRFELLLEIFNKSTTEPSITADFRKDLKQFQSAIDNLAKQIQRIASYIQKTNADDRTVDMVIRTLEYQIAYIIFVHRENFSPSLA